MVFRDERPSAPEKFKADASAGKVVLSAL